MKTRVLRTLLLWALTGVCTHVVADTFGSGTNRFEIEFVKIGDPGNAADTTGAPNPAGSVDYVYRIGKIKATRDMLEKGNAAGGLGITQFEGTDGIGNNSGQPATGVSWNEAARFTNWLNTSQGYLPAYKFSNQPGEAGYDANSNIELWTDGELGFDANHRFRNGQARYFLPSADEWYKAAYYDPDANGGAGGYWNYATGSDLNINSMLDVLSPFGVKALGMSPSEWEETTFDLMNDDSLSRRGTRGTVGLGGVNYSATSRSSFGPMGEGERLGFRVVSIPEPSSQLMGLIGMLGILLRRLGQPVES